MEKEILTVRVPPKLKNKLFELSHQKGLTVNAIIVETLWNNLEKCDATQIREEE